MPDLLQIDDIKPAYHRPLQEDGIDIFPVQLPVDIQHGFGGIISTHAGPGIGQAVHPQIGAHDHPGQNRVAHSAHKALGNAQSPQPNFIEMKAHEIISRRDSTSAGSPSMDMADCLSSFEMIRARGSMRREISSAPGPITTVARTMVRMDLFPAIISLPSPVISIICKGPSLQDSYLIEQPS